MKKHPRKLSLFLDLIDGLWRKHGSSSLEITQDIWNKNFTYHELTDIQKWLKDNRYKYSCELTEAVDDSSTVYDVESISQNFKFSFDEKKDFLKLLSTHTNSLPNQGVYELDNGLIVNLNNGQLTYHGNNIMLSKNTEPWRILKKLIDEKVNQNSLITYHELALMFFNEKSNPSYQRSIQSHIYEIRKKLKLLKVKNPNNLIKNVSGEGFFLNAEII